MSMKGNHDLLDNTAKMREMDKLDVLGALAKRPEQFRDSFRIADSTKIDKFTPDRIIICGMGGSAEPGGVRASVLGADGSGGELLIIPGGGARHPAGPETVLSKMHYVKMNGREVYRFATRVMAEATRGVVARAGWSLDQIDLFIPHQANARIIDSAAKALKLAPDKVFVNLQNYGNTSAASIPIALCEAVDAGKIKPGAHLVLVGFGAGLTWAACAVEWTASKPGAPALRHRAATGRLRYAWSGLKALGWRVLRHVDAGVSKAIDGVERKPPEE